jgi:hypothetical protein
VKERFFFINRRGRRGHRGREKREIRYILATLIAILIDIHPRLSAFICGKKKSTRFHKKTGLNYQIKTD